MSQSSHPIIAIATAPGRGGIGIIRISGPTLGPFIFALLGRTLLPRYATYCEFTGSDQTPIDQGIALFFKGPNSYTGEDILELQGHGGPAVLQTLLSHCLTLGTAFGARLADPGEFTLRAFLNNKIDLTQAEAIADLIDASSEAAARAAISSYSGRFSFEINALNDAIIHLRILIEATLDFPEEEIEFLEKFQVRERLSSLQQQLVTILSRSRQGMVLREGLHVVLTGEPNVGKSSLLNALAGEELAIVTDIAGTTRDKVSQLIHLQGVPITVVDTAGLRDTTDKIERIGIERSWAEIAKADVVLNLKDTERRERQLEKRIEEKLSSKSILLNVINKSDLLENIPLPTENTIFISALTGQGLDDLKTRLLKIAGWTPNQETPWLARQRHIDALEAALNHLKIASMYAKENDQVLDLFAEELRLAQEQLGLITGRITPDDLLGKIFSSFCIGK